MKIRIMPFLVVLFLAISLSPTQASTWRSTTGNMFHFYPGGQMEAYVNGQAFNGRWWWTNNPYQFQFPWYGSTATVNIKGSGAVCVVAGGGNSYWTQLGSRGEKEQLVDTTSWFMEQNEPGDIE
jgi:hypothetical protein